MSKHELAYCKVCKKHYCSGCHKACPSCASVIRSLFEKEKAKTVVEEHPSELFYKEHDERFAKLP